MGPSGSLLHYILYVFMSLCLSAYIHLCKFEDMTNAARDLGGLQKDGRFRNPSIALYLVQCAGVFKSKGLVEGNSTLQKAAADFLELYQTDWKERVSSRALGTLEERRWNRPDNLPSSDGVQCVQAIIEELETAGVSLSETQSVRENARLAKVTLASVMLFQQKEAGRDSTAKPRSVCREES